MPLRVYCTIMNQHKISVIIPVYNEERTIPSIVEIVRTWERTDEIVIVNDGSTDKTLQALVQFKGSIRVITYKRNRGKGYALARGIKASRGEILMLLDGDMVGLAHQDLTSMLAPLVKGRARMVLGIAKLWRLGSVEQLNDLSGQRVVWRKDVLPHCEKMKHVGYGVELLLNDAYRHARVVSVRLPYARIMGRFDKQVMPGAFLSYLQEIRELVAEVVRQQANGLTPQARQIVRSIQQYLKQAFEYFQ